MSESGIGALHRGRIHGREKREWRDHDQETGRCPSCVPVIVALPPALPVHFVGTGRVCVSVHVSGVGGRGRHGGQRRHRVSRRRHRGVFASVVPRPGGVRGKHPRVRFCSGDRSQTPPALLRAAFFIGNAQCHGGVPPLLSSAGRGPEMSQHILSVHRSPIAALRVIQDSVVKLIA